MFRSIRMILALLLAFALQTTVIPYFRIWGIAPDLLLYTLLCLTIHCGQQTALVSHRVFYGLCFGLGVSLILEATSVEAAGLSTVVHGVAGLVGALAPPHIEKRLVPGKLSKRARRQLIALIPGVLIAVITLIKEGLYVGYFYLSGVEIHLMHVGRVVWAGIVALGIGLILCPILSKWVDLPLGQTWYGKRWNRWKDRANARKLAKTLRAKPPTKQEVPSEASEH